MIALRLKEERLKRNLTQEEVAKKCEISQQLYCYYEKGYRIPSIPVIKKLANIFNCTTDFLINE